MITEKTYSSMMNNETIILLTYYYHQEDQYHRLLRHIIKAYCPAYLPWDIYLREPLEKIFSRVIVYDYLKRRAEMGLDAMNEEIISLVRKEKPKYVVWTSFYYDVRETTLEAIRRAGSKTLGFFFDDEWRFDSYSRFWAPYLDYCVTNSIEAVPKYKALSANVIDTVPNTGIAVDRDWSDPEYKYDVSFVGSINFVDRQRYMKTLRDNGIPVRLFGKGSGGYVTFDDMLSVFRTSRINLNFSKAGSYHQVRQIKGRVFQVCLAGGFMLTEYAPGLEKYFKIGKEIACFENEAELLQKTRYYLEHEAERQAIAKAGRERASREHTSSSMVSKVFREIEQDLLSGGNSHRAPKLKTPLITRTIYPSDYHFQWGRALLREHYPRERWRGSLKLSLAYSPLNLSAWYYLIAGPLPRFTHGALFAMHDSAVGLPGRILRRLRTIPYIGKAVRSLVKKLI